MVQRVGEHDAALGVGIEHFDRLAFGRVHDVARHVGLSVGHVHRRAHDPHHVERQLEQGDRAQRADHRGAARHVALHPVHVARGFDRDPAAVEGDPLADQCDRRTPRPARSPLQGDHAGRHRRAGTWSRLLEIRALNVSASDIRARLRDGRSVRYLLPEVVIDAVQQSGVYTRG